MPESYLNMEICPVGRRAQRQLRIIIGNGQL